MKPDPKRPVAPSARPADLPSLRLEGRTVLVTGSSKGLGKAMAMALGAAGARVALNYKNGKDAAERTFAEYRERGHQGALFAADVVDECEVGKLCQGVAAELGAIDALVVNATPAQPQQPIEQYDW